ncbi:hypothetical protein LNP74_25095 [Klebsiella pneumoniae subsp. pneumoniae]|nr:hypothetical protein [Klebsiella pneumoniae subsp. pneumoniae]
MPINRLRSEKTDGRPVDVSPQLATYYYENSILAQPPSLTTPVCVARQYGADSISLPLKVLGQGHSARPG